MIKRLFKLIILALIIFVIYGLYTGKYNVFKKFFSTGALLKENKVIYDGNDNISKLSVTLSYTNLIIKDAENFKIETNNKNVKLENKNGVIKINEEKINVSFETKDSNLIIYLPSDKEFSEIEFTTGAGKIEAENLITKKLNLKQGAGKIDFKRLTVLDETKVLGGAGSLDIEYGNIYNLNLTMGAGKTNISALFKGSNKITTGVGEFNINLFNSLNDYKVKINKGLGNIKVNGEEINSNYENGKGLVSLTIEGGVGNINLTSNENNA